MNKEEEPFPFEKYFSNFLDLDYYTVYYNHLISVEPKQLCSQNSAFYDFLGYRWKNSSDKSKIHKNCWKSWQKWAFFDNLPNHVVDFSAKIDENAIELDDYTFPSHNSHQGCHTSDNYLFAIFKNNLKSTN